MRVTYCLLALLVLCGTAFAAAEPASAPLGEREIRFTVDQVATWLAIGVLIAFVVVLVGNIGHRKIGRASCLIFGLIGATAGIFIVNTFQIDLQLGAIVMYYDTLLVAAAVALALLLATRLLARRGKRS